MDRERKAVIGFSYCGGIGPATLAFLQRRFCSLDEAYTAEEKKLARILSQKQLYRFLSFRLSHSVDRILETLHKQNIWVIPCNDSTYPKQLLRLSDPPLCLYGKGKKEYTHMPEELYVSVVGTRKPTLYGTKVAFNTGKTLAGAGIIVVSGMATGIDTAAHEGAIKGGGGTILVLGTAIGKVYPAQNQRLYDDVIQHHGCAISEYPLGATVHQGTFVSRNRIIAAFSKSLIVVEGGIHSGSLVTANCALELGNNVYAVPGPITSEMSYTPNNLLREGAQVFLGADAFLNENGFFFVSSKTDSEKKEIKGLGGEEKRIYEALLDRNLFVDELSQSLHINNCDTLTYLSLLEMRGFVQKQEDGRFTVQ